MDLLITAEHDAAIRAHAQRIHPHECCGFLLGREEDGVRRVIVAQPEVDASGEEERHNRFTLTPEAYRQADNAAREAGLDILGSLVHLVGHVPEAPQQLPVRGHLIRKALRGPTERPLLGGHLGESLHEARRLAARFHLVGGVVQLLLTLSHFAQLLQ